TVEALLDEHLVKPRRAQIGIATKLLGDEAAMRIELAGPRSPSRPARSLERVVARLSAALHLAEQPARRLARDAERPGDGPQALAALAAASYLIAEADPLAHRTSSRSRSSRQTSLAPARSDARY